MHSSALSLCSFPMCLIRGELCLLYALPIKPTHLFIIAPPCSVALSVLVYLKMDRVDKAEQAAKVRVAALVTQCDMRA